MVESGQSSCMPRVISTHNVSAARGTPLSHGAVKPAPVVRQEYIPVTLSEEEIDSHVATINSRVTYKLDNEELVKERRLAAQNPEPVSVEVSRSLQLRSQVTRTTLRSVYKCISDSQ